MNKKKYLSGWGRYPFYKTQLSEPESLEEIKKAISFGKSIARGNGSSYGDSAINRLNTISMRNFNNILDFNSDSGLLIVQSGILLFDIIEKFLPKGWFSFVTPGTKFVTVGGMVSSDVHGKNHYKDGSFGKYIEWIDLMNSDGKILRCSKSKNSKLYYWIYLVVFS